MNRRATLAFLLIAALLSAAYLGKGFAVALFHPIGGDRERRWMEQQYILRGQNPYDVAFREAAIVDHLPPPPSTGRDDSTRPEIGVPLDVDYPPWSYFTGYLIFGVPRSALRPWYALVAAGALGSIVACVWRLGRGLPPLDRAVPVLAVTSMASICTDLGTGNYGLIVLALLLWALRAEEAGRTASGGLLMGVAQLKPNLAGPFLLVPLARGQWRMLAVSAAYLAVASLVIWIPTKTDPLEMCGQMVRAARRHVGASQGPLTLALGMGIPYERAVSLTALACVGICLALLVARRRDSLLVLYAIAAVASRFWTYHRNYSNLIIAFLTLALWRSAVTTGRRLAWGLFLLVTASLWLPAKAADHPVGAAIEDVAWLVGLVGLLGLREASATAAPVGAGEESRPVGS